MISPDLFRLPMLATIAEEVLMILMTKAVESRQAVRSPHCCPSVSHENVLHVFQRFVATAFVLLRRRAVS